MLIESLTPALHHPWPAVARSPRDHARNLATEPAPAAAAPRRGGLTQRALARACAYIDAHLGERFSLAELAAAAAVSRFHFARMFRVSTGTSPMDYLQRVRIETAKAWLGAGRQRVADIAATLGYCDQSHFTRTFRRHTGLSPRDYLLRHAGTAPVARTPLPRPVEPAQALRAHGAAHDDARSRAA